MALPKLFSISSEAQQAAVAATTFSLDVPKPPYPVAKAPDKNGDLHHRWAELGVIEKAWLETSPKGHTGFIIDVKIRTGMPNQNRHAYGRHYLNFESLASGSKDNEVMNNITIAAITAFLKAAGLTPPADGGLPIELLSTVFKETKELGSETPLRGKLVIVNLHEGPNKGEGAREPRGTSVDSYKLPPTTTA